jgi:hypothetical protein
MSLWNIRITIALTVGMDTSGTRAAIEEFIINLITTLFQKNTNIVKYIYNY